jgi:hypothetical protein
MRRRLGAALLVLVALLPVAGVSALATSSRGLTGEISHIWHEFTSPASGGTGDQANRLLAVDNSRGTYWNEALKVGEHHLAAGVGAGAFGTARGYYTADFRPDQHAHGYLVQTFADLGLVGVVLSLALLAAWIVAALRAVGVVGREPPGQPLMSAERDERIGLLTLLAVVITFGVQSAVDWTWFIPGTAVPALIAAGWLAGRGPLQRPIGVGPRRAATLQTPAVGAALAMIAGIVVLAAWTMLQPLRSRDAVMAAITALSTGNSSAAVADARTAISADPVSVDPYLALSQVYASTGHPELGRAELVKATQTQPSNAEPIRWLGEYDLRRGQPDRAISELDRALVLDLGSIQTRQDLASALTLKYAPKPPSGS